VWEALHLQNIGAQLFQVKIRREVWRDGGHHPTWDSAVKDSKGEVISRGDIHDSEASAKASGINRCVECAGCLVVPGNVAALECRVIAATQNVTRGIIRVGAERAVAIGDDTRS
jgi:hypothetical protein